MKARIKTFAIAGLLWLITGPAGAACFADYKAKKDDPLRLHYGVIQITDASCNPQAAFREIAPRVARGGWELLEVMSLFDERGLDARRSDAGQFFLRF